MNTPYRIGHGLDSHKFLDTFDNDKPLILSGVLFDEELSIDANSDGDVVLHAVFNAISQALGERSLGFYADPMCLNDGITDSMEYLKVILKKMEEKQYKIGNIGITIEAKRPKMEDKSPEMKKSLANILSINEDQIGFQFTSGEGLTECGQGKGISVNVVVLLYKYD